MPPGATRQLDYTALFYPDAASAAGCSATFVSDDTILTAAHCLYDPDTHDPFDLAAMVVCTRGNLELSDPLGLYTDPYCWYTVLDTIIDGFTPPSDVNDDFALVRFFRGGVLPPAPATMPISSASASVVEAADVFRASYPGWVRGPNDSCTDPYEYSYFFNPGVAYGTPAFDVANDDPVVISTHRVKTNMDCAEGDSGASYYYIPSPTTGTPFIVGLHAVYNATETYCGGPRASQFRDFVIANL